MKVEIEKVEYDIPTIPQLGDYRYAKECSCECHAFDMSTYNGYVNGIKDFHIDGVYESHIGQLICFTCKRCGEKFCFHSRGDFERFAIFGLLDEYAVKEEK